MNVDVIRTITIKGKTEGVDEATDALKKLADAQGNVAIVSDKVNKTGLSVSDAYQKQTLRLDAAAKSQSQVAAQTSIADKMLAQGGITATDYAARIDLINKKYGEGAATSRAFAAATSGVSGQLIALSAGAGPVGVFLAALGPWGLAAAAGVGLLAVAFEEAKRTATLLAAEAVSLERFAETTGLSTSTLQALTQAAAKHGVSAEEATNAVVRFTTAWAEARDGGGTFLSQLQKIDPGLADQIQRTKDSATAFDLLTKAIKAADEAGNISQRNQLLRAAGGRGGVAALTGVSAASTEAGGLSNLTQQAVEAGKAIDDKLLKEIQVLKSELDETTKHADLLMGSVGAKPILETGLAWQKLRVSMAETIVELAAGEAKLGPWERFFAQVARVQNGLDLTPILKNPVALSGAEPSAVWGPSQAAPGVLQPKDIKAQLADMKEYVTLLGSGATEGDKLKLKLLELTAAVVGNSTAENKYAAAIGMSAAKLDSYIATLTLHNAALGAGATVTDVVTEKMAALAKQQKQGAGLTAEQLDNSKRLIQSQADGTFALQGQIDTLGVQAATFNMSAGAAETFRLIQTATNKALQEGKDPAIEVSAAYRKLAVDAGAGAQALEKVRIDSSISFGRQTAFLLPEDVQIAQQLKGLYGNDIPAALASSEAAAMRLNNTMAEFSNFSRTTLTSFATDIRQSMAQGATAAQAFGTAMTNALGKIEDKLIQMAIDNVWKSAFGGSSAGGVGLLSFLGFGGGNPAVAGAPGVIGSSGPGVAVPTFSAKGNVFDEGLLIHPYALGGLVSDILMKPTLFPMANGMGLAGEAGPEAIIPLRRGSDGKLGVAGGGGNTTIRIHSTYNIEGAVDNEKLAAAIGKSHDDAVKRAVTIVSASTPERMNRARQFGQ